MRGIAPVETYQMGGMSRRGTVGWASLLLMLHIARASSVSSKSRANEVCSTGDRTKESASAYKKEVKFAGTIHIGAPPTRKLRLDKREDHSRPVNLLSATALLCLAPAVCLSAVKLLLAVQAAHCIVLASHCMTDRKRS